MMLKQGIKITFDCEPKKVAALLMLNDFTFIYHDQCFYLPAGPGYDGKELQRQVNKMFSVRGYRAWALMIEYQKQPEVWLPFDLRNS